MKLAGVLKTFIFTAACFALVGFGLTGMVGASSYTISNTGPDSTNEIEITNDRDCQTANNNDVTVFNDSQQTALTGNASVGSGWMLLWNNWNPDSWSKQGHSFDSWQQGFNAWLDSSASSSTWSSDNTQANVTGNDWTPNGNNWQEKWNNWSPLTWAVNGQSYDNWHSQLITHLDSQYNKWAENWGGNTTGGDAVSGDASNTSVVNTSVTINNSDACKAENAPAPNPGQGGGQGQPAANGSPATQGMGGGSGNFSQVYYQQNQTGQPAGQGGGGGSTPTPCPTATPDPNVYTIRNTGPDSNNEIEVSYHSDVEVTNNNSFGAENGDQQYASSGDTQVAYNTTAGVSTAGDAGNASSVSTSVNIVN